MPTLTFLFKIILAKKHKKRSSTSLIIREVQIKTTMKYYLIVTRMDFITNLQLIHAGEKNPTCIAEKGTLLQCWWKSKLIQQLWRTVWRFLKKLKTELQYDPAILLLGIQTEKTMIPKDTCIPVFTEALFTTARTWKQPEHISTEEQIKKMWYIYTMYY